MTNSLTSADHGAARTHGRGQSATVPLKQPLAAALATFVALSAVVLAVALFVGATFVFNLVVWLLFTVLWAALLTTIALAPAIVDQLWESLRRRTIAIQAVIWLLFLPIMVGAWIWRRTWAPPIRLTLLLAIAAWNVFLFFPRG